MKNKPGIGALRQWLNEDRITDIKKMVTNEEILVWIHDESEIRADEADKCNDHMEIARKEGYDTGHLHGREEERQFILNILDGVDIADEQMGNPHGGTKAIRLALQSRVI